MTESERRDLRQRISEAKRAQTPHVIPLEVDMWERIQNLQLRLQRAHRKSQRLRRSRDLWRQRALKR